MKIDQAIETIKEHLCTGEAKGRCIVTLDRGWIFVGDLMKTDDGYILTNCANVRKWSSGGFGGLTKGKETSGAVVDPCESIRFPGRTLIFYAPVSRDWS